MNEKQSPELKALLDDVAANRDEDMRIIKEFAEGKRPSQQKQETPSKPWYIRFAVWFGTGLLCVVVFAAAHIINGFIFSVLAIIGLLLYERFIQARRSEDR